MTGLPVKALLMPTLCPVSVSAFESLPRNVTGADSHGLYSKPPALVVRSDLTKLYHAVCSMQTKVKYAVCKKYANVILIWKN